MCADSAQGDHEFTGDLRPRKLGFEQSENFKLTLAYRLDWGLRSGEGGEEEIRPRSSVAPLQMLPAACLYSLA